VEPATTISCVFIAIAVGIAITTLVVLRRVRLEVESRYRRTEAWVAIHAILGPRAPLGPTGAWVASPELLHELMVLIFETRPQRIVELGSGMSTVVCAYALQKLGAGGTVVSLDHEPRFAEITRRKLIQHGLEGVASVVDAPLCATSPELGGLPWYDVPAEAVSEPIDLLVVDGPPGGGNALTRFPALPALRRHLSPGAVIVVDDAKRPGEQEIVRRWHAQAPEFSVEQRCTEKGTAILRRLTGTKAPVR